MNDYGLDDLVDGGLVGHLVAVRRDGQQGGAEADGQVVGVHHVLVAVLRQTAAVTNTTRLLEGSASVHCTRLCAEADTVILIVQGEKLKWKNMLHPAKVSLFGLAVKGLQAGKWTAFVEFQALVALLSLKKVRLNQGRCLVTHHPHNKSNIKTTLNAARLHAVNIWVQSPHSPPPATTSLEIIQC